MAEDKSVMTVYETWDYKKFKPLENNRGRIETGGIDVRRLYHMQNVMEANEWVRQHSLVEVNEAKWILDGLHNFTHCVNNKIPIWYFVNTDSRYNARNGKFAVLDEVMKRNRIDTTWNNKEIFNCALNSGECPLAQWIYKQMTSYDVTFHWYELLAVIAREQRFFHGKKKDFNLRMFKNEDYLTTSRSFAFKPELEFFVKFCAHVQTPIHRKNLLSFVYGVLWYESTDVIDKQKFRKAVLNLPPDFLESEKSLRDAVTIRKKLISLYNSIAGANLNWKAIIFSAHDANALKKDIKKIGV